MPSNLISISLAPNTHRSDLQLAQSLIFSPSHWEKGPSKQELEASLERYLDLRGAVTFETGRSALLAILKVLGIGRGDEVLLQAFTCVAVPNPVIWTGAKPVYVDIDRETLNLDPSDLERKITSQSKAVIIQHTFGLPTPLDKLMPLVKKHHLGLIEDCAHSLGAKQHDQKIGTLGDAAFFSFGKDKVIGVASGGAAIFSRNGNLTQKLKQFQASLSYPPRPWIFRQLLSPITAELILKTYSQINVGKLLHRIFLGSGIRPRANTSGEKKRAEKPPWIPSQMPNALAKLTLEQLEHLEEFNQRRKKIAKYYSQELAALVAKFPTSIKVPTPHLLTAIPNRQDHHDDQSITVDSTFLRFPILVSKPRELIQFAKQHSVILGDWYNPVVAPKGVNFKAIEYPKGSCPVAEETSEKIVNLPTNPTLGDADVEKVIGVIQAFFAKTKKQV